MVQRPHSDSATGDSTGIVPLKGGERLTRDEFEGRYDATVGLARAELVEGFVHIPPGVGWHKGHCPSAAIIVWLGCYGAATPGVQVGSHPSLRLDPENEPQPNAVMIISDNLGGGTRVSADDFLEGAPELVAEMVPDKAGIDMSAKLRVYARNNVREYIVWRVRDAAIDWFVLRHDGYGPLHPGPDGIYRSETFPGLWLDATAMVQADIVAVMDTLQRGLDSREHAAFVAQLQNARGA